MELSDFFIVELTLKQIQHLIIILNMAAKHKKPCADCADILQALRDQTRW